MKKKSKKKKVLTLEQQQARIKSAFKRKIRNIFTGAGFEYIPTNNHEMKIGHRAVEVDSLFIYENIWLLGEDTIKTTDVRDHIRTKNEAFGIIKKNIRDYVDQLIKLFPEKEDILKKYDVSRIKVFGLYIPQNELSLTDDDEELFGELLFVQPKTLSYFQWLVSCIKLSARNEIFRFLNLNSDQIGKISSSSASTQITAPIIYPKEFTGIKGNVRLVSFMMSAEDLLNTCYVLRKDNWEDSIWLYQRLIEKNKIKGIREFIAKKGEAFYNNIIVALPDNVSFRDIEGKYWSVEEIGDLENNCKLVIPKEINSICVIDGQHRIFSHYESGLDTEQERKISELRQQLHLLVTGLIFPPEMLPIERAQLQSQIFLDINSNAKSVPPNVLLQIKRINNPIADESIAQFVIEKMNKEGVFCKLLQISSLDNAKIKTASIVKFALRYLVSVSPQEGKQSLFEFWEGDKSALICLDHKALEEYVKYCAKILNTYFGAIRKNLKKYWDSDTSKILSVISINGFIIAFTRQLKINGVNDFDYYDNLLKDWEFDFSNDVFPYTSSQYRKFSNQILREVYKLSEDVIKTI